jgi:hypothetical protein
MSSLQGAAFTLSPSTSADRAEASQAFDKSELDKQLEDAIFGATFERSVSPPRHSGHISFGAPGRSSLRSSPFDKHKPSRNINFDLNASDKESLKASIACETGHVPNYGGQAPFGFYDSRRSPACSSNGVNAFLKWNPDKSKYCCDATPDSNQIIMERSLNNVKNMVKGVTIDPKSLPYFNHAVGKYLRHFNLVNPDRDEQMREEDKMRALRKQFLKLMPRPEYEAKSLREEGAGHTRDGANQLWETAFARLPSSTPSEGGRARTRVKRHVSKRHTRKQFKKSRHSRRR